MEINLNTPIENVFRLKLPQKKALEKLKISTVEDLLYHFPTRYQSGGTIKNIKEIKSGELVTLFGILSKLKTKKGFKSKIPMSEGILTDETGAIKIIWFHQAFISKTYKDGDRVKIVGKVQENKNGMYISNPEIEKINSQDVPALNMFSTKKEKINHLYPVYPEVRGITSRWFFHAIEKLISNNINILEKIEDPIPKQILKKYNLPDIKKSLLWMHIPKNERNYISARKRFSFQEIFIIQLKRLIDKYEYQSKKAHPVSYNQKDLDNFINRFPFSFTNAQNKALKQILEDIKKQTPMTRLLEGDVGSGKTAVAACVVFATVTTRPEGKDFGNLQAVYMAPTEILARQHFESFIEYFKNSSIQIGFISGSECRKFPSKINPNGYTKISKSQLLKWVENGEIPILIGTHSLIQKTVKFKNLALAIIDEQHRFGVKQRALLLQKKSKFVPHLLSMTATPIPRSLALTIYGDLDLTLIDEMPKGRKRVNTQYVPPKDRNKIYEKLRKELQSGRQAYVICPRIDEPDPEKAAALRVKSATEEAKRLQNKIFPEYNVGLVHSKLKPKEKEQVMKDFIDGKIHILVATSVIEVGVNVPNATNIIIEGAERFGLAQLHQLRGRVLRSSYNSYCYLFSDTSSKKSKDRLNALITAKNGFELAEKDLALRGEGSLSGEKQWGLSDVGMDAIKNIKMVEAARIEAKELINKKELQKYPLLEQYVNKKESIHFE